MARPDMFFCRITVDFYLEFQIKRRCGGFTTFSSFTDDLMLDA
jgi:fluoride ion exporter CrcB/FEX